MSSDALIDIVYQQTKESIAAINKRISDTRQQTERGETAGGVVAFTYAAAPRAAQGGMSNGTEYIDIAFISNGRKSGEGVGAGTGQLCYYDASIDDYRRVRDDSVVTV